MQVFLPAKEVVADPQRRPVLMAAVSPARAREGAAITIRGSHFGSTPGSIVVGDQRIDQPSWSDWAVTFTLPGKLPPGPARLTLTTSDKRQRVFPLDSLTVEP